MTRSQEGHGPESPDPQLLQRLAVEGEAGFSEYETGGRPEVLEAAVTAFRLAVDVVPPGHPARAGCPGFSARTGLRAGRRPEPRSGPELRCVAAAIAGADNSSAHVSGLMVPAARARGTFYDDTLTAGPLPLGDDDRPCCDWPISP